MLSQLAATLLASDLLSSYTGGERALVPSGSLAAFPFATIRETAIVTIGELLELAAIITSHAPLLIDGQEPLPTQSLSLYWSASKCLQQRWARALKQALETSKRGDDQSQTQTRRASAATRALIDEIFAGEVLTRVFAAIVTAHERRRQTTDAEPIVRSVLTGHLESRRRALSLLAGGLPIDSGDGPEINRRRRRAERWNDLFIGRLQAYGDVNEFAFEPETADQFANDFREQGRRAEGLGWTLVTASLHAASRGMFAAGGGNRDLRQQIGAAVLGCFGPDAFDALGLPRSLWAARMVHTADSAQGLLERFFAVGEPLAAPHPGFIIGRAKRGG